MKKTILMLALFGILFITCKHEATPVLKGTTPISTTEVPIPNLPLSNSICFTTQILPIFKANCSMRNGCHIQPTDKDAMLLTNYAEIKANLSEIMKEINSNKMPSSPYPLLNAAVKATLVQWINEGANETNCYHTPFDTTNIKYSTHIAPMISAQCLGCHNSTNAQANVQLQTYSLVKQHAESGLIFSAVKGKGVVFMPYGGLHIGLENLRRLEIWRDAGLPQ